MFVCVVLLSQPSSRDLLYAKRLCVVLLSQPSSRDLDNPLWEVSYLEIKNVYKEKEYSNAIHIRMRASLIVYFLYRFYV